MKLLKLIIVLYAIYVPHILKADYCIRTFENDSITAQAIFVGKVAKIEKGKYWYRGQSKTIFTFKILESFKGLETYNEYISLIGPIHGCCNIHFVKDSTFLVFAYGDCNESNLLWTNDCSNTGPLSIEKDIYKRLGEPKIHESKKSENFKYFMNRGEIERDSLVKVLNNLTLEIKSLKSSNKTHTMVLGLLFFISIIIIIYLLIKRRK